MMKPATSRSIRFWCVMEQKAHITAFNCLSILYLRSVETLLDKMKTTGEAAVLQITFLDSESQL